MKYKYISLLAILTVILLQGCEAVTIQSSEIINVKYIKIDPPKHTYVYFDDNGNINKTFVSKRCSNWKIKDVKNTNNTIKIKKIIYSDGLVNYDIDSELRKQFCD